VLDLSKALRLICLEAVAIALVAILVLLADAFSYLARMMLDTVSELQPVLAVTLQLSYILKSNVKPID
jgi:hypothetical protein